MAEKFRVPSIFVRVFRIYALRGRSSTAAPILLRATAESDPDRRMVGASDDGLWFIRTNLKPAVERHIAHEYTSVALPPVHKLLCKEAS